MAPLRSTKCGSAAAAIGGLIALQVGAVCPPPSDDRTPVAAVVSASLRVEKPLENAEPPAEKQPGPILTGRIVDENGKPLKGVKVQLYSGLATRWEGQSARTGEDGVYRFDPLETGSMMQRGEEKGVWDYYVGLRLEHPTHVSSENAAWWDLNVPSDAGKVTTRDFTFVKGGIIRGVVQTYDGFAWREMAIRIHPLSPEHKGATGWYATTGKKGEFETLAMTPGEYAIQWNDNHSDYAELERVTVEAGKVTSVKVSVRVNLKVEESEVTKEGMKTGE